MASAIEVVFEAEREIVTEILLIGEVGLMRDCVLKSFASRESEGQERQRHGSRGIQEVLVDEDGGRIRRGIEPLLIGQVVKGGGKTPSNPWNALVAFRFERVGLHVPGAPGKQNKLRSLRAIGHV